MATGRVGVLGDERAKLLLQCPQVRDLVLFAVDGKGGPSDAARLA